MFRHLKKKKHPMLGKQVRVFTNDDEREYYAGIGDSTLVHICNSHIVVKVVDSDGESWLAMHPLRDIKEVDTI